MNHSQPQPDPPTTDADVPAESDEDRHDRLIAALVAGA